MYKLGPVSHLLTIYIYAKRNAERMQNLINLQKSQDVLKKRTFNVCQIIKFGIVQVPSTEKYRA